MKKFIKSLLNSFCDSERYLPASLPACLLTYLTAADREDLKPYWKSEKKGHISLDDQQSYNFQVFQRL